MYIDRHAKYPLFFSVFIEIWIFSTDFSQKSSSIKFHENRSCGSRIISRGEKDRKDKHDEANRCFSQFCEHA